METILWAAGGTGFTFLMTVLGAAAVLPFGKTVGAGVQRALYGLAAGVMLAASVFSLLLPAIEAAEGLYPGWLAAGGGMLAGTLTFMAVDRALGAKLPETGGGRKRTMLLTTAMTLHNIPEGMAVGLSFALAAEGGGLSAAMALAMGIGIQNFPEGAAVSLPLRQEGLSRGRAFGRGAASGVVEPLFGILAAAVYGAVRPVMPWLLAFAAGAMLYVTVEELIPQAQLDGKADYGTLSVMAGFLIMMALDVALG